MGQGNDPVPTGRYAAVCFVPPGRKRSDEANPMISLLYFDDWEFLLGVVKQYLESRGDVMVDTARSFTEAIHKIRTNRYDTIVTDYNLAAGAITIDLLRRAREYGITTPFIFFTLEDHYLTEEEAKLYGPVRFVRKLIPPPSGIKELDRIVRTNLADPGVHSPNREYRAERGNPA
jgi:CheY-like chemotaxis protein